MADKPVSEALPTPAPAKSAPAKRKLFTKSEASRSDLGPKIHVPTGTMNTVLRHVTTRVSLRGFRRLLENCLVATCSLQHEQYRDQLVALHAMMCLYDLHIKVELESARMWGQSSLVGFMAYRPVDKVVALALESLSSWKSPRGYYVYVEPSFAREQLDEMRRHFWPRAFPGTPVPAEKSDYGSARFTEFSKFESEVKRALGNDAMRVPSESPDFSILHIGVLKFAAGNFSVCGFSEVSLQSELLCRVLELRRYQREGLAYAYVPADESDYDSIHLTSGYSSGRSWSLDEAMFQLRSAVSVNLNRVA